MNRIRNRATSALIALAPIAILVATAAPRVRI